MPVERAALEPVSLDVLERAGLVAVAADSVAPAARAVVLDGLLIFGDAARVVDDGGLEAVTVLSGSTELTASLTVRRRMASALDLGCGSGAQALLAAGHCDRVTGVDLNERALRFARLNAELNGVDSIRFLHGSWFEPLDAGEQFDLIVANLPFVPAPSVRSLYRDSPLPAEELIPALVEQCLDRLTEDGVAHLTIAWTRAESESALAFPTELLRGRPCDSLLFRHGGVPAQRYVAGLAPTAPADTTLVEAYLEHYERRGIDVIETAHLVLRRRHAPRNWRRTVRLLRMPAGRCGDHVDRIIRAQDWLQQASDDDVRQSAFTAAPHEVVTGDDGRAVMRGVPDIGFSGALPGDTRNLVGLGFLVPVSPGVARSDGDR